VSADAFQEAYDYYKKNAVGDTKTREEFLLQLRNDLAEYQDSDDGTKSVTRGLLKDFTDDNYSQALAVGENVVNAALKGLSEVQFPDFESFKVAREQTTADVQAQLQKNVAFPELSERLLTGVKDLSTKLGLTFGLSAAEKEKEELLAAEARKHVERQKKEAENQKALMDSQQRQTNVEQEKKTLSRAKRKTIS